MELLEHLEYLMKLKLRAQPKRLRLYTDRIRSDARALIITGPRGVGKTTQLLDIARSSRILYFSGDTPTLGNKSLWEVGETAFQAGYEGIAIDEVHYLKDWSIHLKALYDSYPDRRILASDSSSLILRAGKGDLSRRFIMRYLPLLSFREYLHLKLGIEAPVFDPFLEDKDPFEAYRSQGNVLAFFRDYLKRGMRPFFLEGDYEERLFNILEKTIYQDIPFFLPLVTDNHLRLMRAIVGYLSESPIPTLKVRNLCTEWGLGVDKLYHLLSVMEHTGLLRIIRKKNDHKANTVGAKLFFHDPSLYHALGGQIGNVREAYVAASLLDAGKKVYASTREEHYDILADDLKLEIGGIKKGLKQADFVLRDGMELRSGRAIPLWMLGFLY